MNSRLITLTNSGYKHITNNMLFSLQNIGIIDKITVFCLDESTHGFLSERYPECDFEVIANTGSEKLIDFRRDGWNHIVFYKMKAIYNSLLKYDRVLFTDGDIVFYKNPLENLENSLKDKDILLQTDLIVSNEKYNEYFNIISEFKTAQQLADYIPSCEYLKSEANTGFIYIKNTPQNIDFFNYNNIDINTFECDQIYVNKNLNKLNYALLPIFDYPTGLFIKSLYLTIIKCLPPDLGAYHFIIHYNYTLASYNKVSTIKMMNSWYVD